MTKEESKVMWELEKANTNTELLTGSMKKLHKIVDKMITKDVITYEDFTNDMIDAITDNIIALGNGEFEEATDRSKQVDNICEALITKYEEKYNKRESVEGDSELSEDITELQDESGVCEPKCADEAC